MGNWAIASDIASNDRTNNGELLTGRVALEVRGCGGSLGESVCIVMMNCKKIYFSYRWQDSQVCGTNSTSPRLRQGSGSRRWRSGVASGNLASGRKAMRSEVVRVRLRPEERQALADLCGEDRTASDVIRLLFRDRAGLPLPVGPVEADALRATNEELRRIGINLNQAVRGINEGRVGYEPHLDAALRSLLEGVFRLRADVDLMLRISRRGRRRDGHGV